MANKLQKNCTDFVAFGGISFGFGGSLIGLGVSD
jgi:hypothetical protein